MKSDFARIQERTAFEEELTDFLSDFLAEKNLYPAESVLAVHARSRNMSRVRSRDTGPEKHIRSLLHGLGLRFRLSDRALPGTPDVVLRKYGTVIFVNGYFWHRHKGCSRATTPETRREFWEAKFACNVARDERNRKEFRRLGWRVIVVWECRVKEILSHPERLARAVVGRSRRRFIEL